MTRPARSLLLLVALCGVAAAIVWMFLLSPSAVLKKDGVSFNAEIAPIVFENCLPCHHEGGSAPFALSTYEDVKKHAQQIQIVTESRYMPPWMPEPMDIPLAGERRLSDEQISLIRRWVQQGAPQGDSPAPIPALETAAAGGLGEPDLVITMPQPYMLQAEGADVFRNFVFPVPVEGTRYVRSLELRPGNPKIVHHANVLIDRSGSSRLLDEQDREIGFAGMELEIESESFDPHTHFLFWKPGTAPLLEPEEMSWRLDADTDLVVNMHLQPSGKIEPVQPSIALYFSSRPPSSHPMLVQLENDGAIDIPPGAKDFVVTDHLELPSDVDVLGVYPHAHYLGRRLEAFAQLPDGSQKWLLRIPKWDFNWQGVYRYAKPIFLPKRTVVHMSWSFDNSTDNAKSPRPPRRVVAGDRTSDEMAHLWIQVLPKGDRDPRGDGDPRLEVQAALMRRRLQKYPGDFTAYFNLGAALEAMNQPQEAIVQFRKALDARPQSAVAHNSLGSALYALGEAGEAMAQFRRAVDLRPDYASAHYNLGQAYARRDDFGNAVVHFQKAARLRPGDAAARADLGTALFAAGRSEEAVRELSEALRLDSASLNAHYSLASLFLTQGRFEKAEQHFREALRLTSSDADIYTGLGTALAAQNKLPEAATQFEHALRINPEHAVARRSLGLAAAGERRR